jgi:hypothetical protein
MRRMRLSRTWVVASLFASVAAAPQVGAQQQDPYPATLQFGTGLINTPVAWVSPTWADTWVQTSAKTLPSFPGASMSVSTLLNTNIAIDTHWRWFSVGAAAYSQNPEWGFFGQARLYAERAGSMLPSLAVGVRNIGPYNHEDRLLISHDVHLDPADSTYKKGHDPRYDDLNSTPTAYVVATKSFNFAAGGKMKPTSASLNLGWGSGLFLDDGGLGDNYNRRGTIAPGFFLGARAVMHPTLNTTIQWLVEDDGWDVNLGVIGDWRGISLGLYGTEIEEGGKQKSAPGFNVYNYAKFNVTLGYSGNIIDISRGVILRSRIAGLLVEQERLRREIAARQRRIDVLEVTLRKAQAGELAEIAQRRAQLESQLQQEMEAIRRAEQRLNDMQRQPGSPPPSTHARHDPSGLGHAPAGQLT